MIFLPILFGAAIIVGAMAAFWNALVGWLKRVVEKVQEIIGAAIQGVKTFIVRLGDGIKKIAKNYSRNKITDEWEETITKKSVEERDVPPELIARINAKIGVEIDMTDELLAKLQH